MAKTTKTHYSEIDDIRGDIDSLKSNIIELTKHLKKDGQAQSRIMKKRASERLSEISEAGSAQYKNFETQVKDKPAQSVALAFVAGAALNYLLSNRR